nr:MAG TPA: hypothetical protein [Caudoviricetes sp.]
MDTSFSFFIIASKLIYTFLDYQHSLCVIKRHTEKWQYTYQKHYRLSMFNN